MRKKVFLSVVIPMFNEKENLRKGVLGEVENYLKSQRYTWEVIISDDGSIDNSRKLVEEFVKKHPNFKLVKNKHAGKPFAVREGVRRAKGEIVLLSDMAQSTPITQVTKLLPFFRRGYEVVIGSRGVIRKDSPWYRQVLSWGFRTARRIFLLRDIIDTQCGFKAFKKEVVKDLFSRLQIFKDSQKVTGWRVTAYDVELLFLAQKRGYKIAEVPVSWQDRDLSLGKQRRFFRESKEMLKEIVRVKLNDLRGVYGLKNYGFIPLGDFWLGIW